MKLLAIIEVDREHLMQSSDATIAAILQTCNRDGVSITEYREIRTYHPGLSYPRLNLAHLLTVPANKRNEYIALTYNYKAVDAYHCGDEEVLICGDEEDGFAEEESLVEYVLGYSGIEIGKMYNTEEPYKENSVELIQDGIVYLVDYIMSDAGCSETCEHFNFNTLRLKEM